MSSEDKLRLANLQRRASFASHKLQKDFALAQDKSLADEIKHKYGLSAKHIDYLQKDAVAAGDAYLAQQKILQEQLIDLEKCLKKEKKKVKRQKLEEKILRKKRSMDRAVVFGGRNNLELISKGTAREPKKVLAKYRKARCAPLFFQGEAARKGSRFFDLSGMAEGNVEFSYSKALRISISFSVKPGREEKLLRQLSNMAQERIMPIAVRLTEDAISFTYDDQLLVGRNIQPSKEFYAGVRALDLPEKEAKAMRAQEFHRLQANLLAQHAKLPSRFAAIDLNPNGIGVVVADKTEDGSMRVIDKSFLDFGRLLNKKVSFAKRRYETSILFKKLFLLLIHYRCGTLICEELDMKNNDLGNKTANRKTNNQWLRGKAKQQITKRIVQTGMLLTEVNPVYSSFIGNILNKEYDPIAAAHELCRRGIHKYETGGLYPSFCMDGIINGLGGSLPKKMYDEAIACKNWKGLSDLFSMRGLSIRRKRDDFLFSDQPLSGRRSLMRVARSVCGKDIPVLAG